MEFSRIRQARDAVGYFRAQWRMAGRYGYRSNLVAETLSGHWERLWLCRLQRKHRMKFTSHGTCVRCGKAIR